MFGRKQEPTPSATTDHVGADHSGPTEGKGHATPTRAQARDARKAMLKGTTTTKGGKAGAGSKSERREAQRADRERARIGMMNGDEKYMSARDRGPGKAMARDYVDGRFTIAEYFIFVAVAVLLLGFVKNPVVSQFVYYGFFVITAFIAIDSIILVIGIKRRAAATFTNPADRKGLAAYSVIRSLQLRRLRLPPPRVNRRGIPIAPKR